MLSDKSKAEIRKLREEYPDPQSALLPALYLAQRDNGGWLPEQALDEVSAVMDLPSTLVASVATFYTLFNAGTTTAPGRRPVGRHLVQVCTNVSCSLLGAQHLLDYLSRKLGVSPGETTPDGNFTLREVECLGSCGTAPVMQVDEQIYESLTEDQIDAILASLAGS